VDVDPDLLAAAGEVLGTRTKKDTVTAALQAAVAGAAQRRELDMIRTGAWAELHSARGPNEYDQWATTRAQAYRSLPLTPAAGERALQVQRELAHLGLHRAAKLPDLLIAAIAETAGATVLHYNSDYDHINAVTGQPTEWIVARGSID
jgi:predicted nucleic acid-binding protein